MPWPKVKVSPVDGNVRDSMDIAIKVNMVTQPTDMVASIERETSKFMTDILHSAAGPVKNKLSEAISVAIRSSPEAISMIEGELKQQLGLLDASPIISDIVKALQTSMMFDVEPAIYSGGRLSGGYSIGISQKDFRDVLNISDSSYVTKNNITVSWLSWLLFYGDIPIIYGYKLVSDPNNSSNSRTGAVMVKDPGGSWGIPSQYSGIESDNFIIRALLNVEHDINNIILEEFRKRI